MTKKLLRCASLLQWAGSLLLLFAALRADGGLVFWLAPALTGILLAAFGLGLWWLCSDQGLAFRRRTFDQPALAPTAAVPQIIPFPKAG